MWSGIRPPRGARLRIQSTDRIDAASQSEASAYGGVDDEIQAGEVIVAVWIVADLKESR